MIAIPANFELPKNEFQQARTIKLLGGGNIFKVHAFPFFDQWGQINIVY